MDRLISSNHFFFFNDTATTEIYTLSLHDALPICLSRRCAMASSTWSRWPRPRASDRKSTRLNSSHTVISYAVFCLKKKKVSNPCSCHIFMPLDDRVPMESELSTH